MASKLFSASVFMLVLFCSLLMRETSGCSSYSAYPRFHPNEGSLKTIQSRKILCILNLKDKKTNLKVSLEGYSTKIKNGESAVIGELRTVPTGPDPIHNHHRIDNATPNGESAVNGELRTVPTGPDPIHNHHRIDNTTPNGKSAVIGELRTIPTGPDPIHNHHRIDNATSNDESAMIGELRTIPTGLDPIHNHHRIDNAIPIKP